VERGKWKIICWVGISIILISVTLLIQTWLLFLYMYHSIRKWFSCNMRVLNLGLKHYPNLRHNSFKWWLKTTDNEFVVRIIKTSFVFFNTESVMPKISNSQQVGDIRILSIHRDDHEYRILSSLRMNVSFSY